METVMKDYSADQVATVGITNQRETTVVWDVKTGQPLHRAIVWLDTRTRGVVEQLVAKHGSADHFRPIVGLPVSTYFSGLKCKWLIDNVAAVREAVEARTARFGTIDSWLIWNLTGGTAGGNHLTTACNASRTFLMNINTLSWDPSMCKELGVPEFMLPKICSNSELFGTFAHGALKGKSITGVRPFCSFFSCL